MSNAYYLIRDAKEDNHVIAVHRIYDSAIACFQNIIMEDTFERAVDILQITVDTFGRVKSERLLYSYSKVNKTLMNYQILATGQLMIKLPD